MRLPLPVLASAAAVLLAACATGPSLHSRYGDREIIDDSSVPGDTAFDRSGFGTASLPFWSQLTPPEIRALQGRDRAASGDNRALFQLAVFASGDVRSDSGYAAIQARFDAFVDRERAVLARIGDPDRKADRLLRDMHSGFFKGGGAPGGRQPGYDYDQSAFTGIFTEGRFNCVSSAILYVLLAREFGFSAQGAVMPRHAYAHLVFPDGRSAEVETTTPDGCEKAHAGANAPKRARSWYTARGLDPGMALDYERRRLVDPLGLIAFNMRNQHLLALSLRDRYRVHEARAWVDPGNAQAQVDRVSVWELENRYLSGRREWEAADRMFRAIVPLLPEAHARLAMDPGHRDHPAWLAYARARAGFEVGRRNEALAWSDTALAWTPAGFDTAGTIRGNVMGLIIRVSQRDVDGGRFAAAERLLLGYPDFVRDSLDYRGNLSWVYSKWSHATWEKKDWAATIDHIEKSLLYVRRRDAESLEKNLAGAFFNRALAYRNSGERGKADALLRECRERLPRAKACREEP